MTLDNLAKRLGYAGLIPFVVFSVGTWISLPLVENSHFILQTYAAVILSFMGAIHWGVAMAQSNYNSNWQLGLSVVPALLGWFSLLIPMLYGYALLIICFSVLCVLDKLLGNKGKVPGWYPPMRVVLTTVVVLCLILASVAIVSR